MNDKNSIMVCLRETPLILENMLNQIPPSLLKEQRRKHKWCIHEHVCHLAEAEGMIYRRFQQFATKEELHFMPYIPGKTVAMDTLLNMDMAAALRSFRGTRKSMMQLVNGFDQKVWKRKAHHHEYTEYSAYILLRHTLMHDHFHLYRIEELWLTRDEFL